MLAEGDRRSRRRPCILWQSPQAASASATGACPRSRPAPAQAAAAASSASARPPLALDRLREPEHLLHECTKPDPGGTGPLRLAPPQLLDRPDADWEARAAAVIMRASNGAGEAA